MTDEWAGVLDPAERDAVCARIDAWAERTLAEGGALVAVDRQVGGDPITGAPRWYLRLQGDEKEFDLPPEKAFGTAESGPVIELPKNRLPADAVVTVGTMFQADLAGNNQTINMVVLEDRVSSIKVRVIHPLAGKAIHVKAKVLGVRDARPEELGN